MTPAEELLEKFNGEWNGSVEPIFEEYADRGGYSAACASDRLSSDETMCSASASASAVRSCDCASARSCRRAVRESLPRGEHAHARPHAFPAAPRPRGRRARRRHRGGIRAGVEHAVGAPGAFQPFVAVRRQLQLGRPRASGSGVFVMDRMAVRGDPEQPLARKISDGALVFEIGDDGEVEVGGVDAVDQLDVGSQTTVSSTPG